MKLYFSNFQQKKTQPKLMEPTLYSYDQLNTAPQFKFSSEELRQECSNLFRIIQLGSGYAPSNMWISTINPEMIMLTNWKAPGVYGVQTDFIYTCSSFVLISRQNYSLLSFQAAVAYINRIFNGLLFSKFVYLLVSKTKYKYCKNQNLLRMQKTIEKQDLIDKIIQQKYKIIKRKGQGYFADVYQCFDLQTNKHYALKSKSFPAKGHNMQNQINTINELNKLIALNSKGCQTSLYIKIPKIIYSRIQTQKKSLFVMDLCDCSLEEILCSKPEGFELDSILTIGYLLFFIIQFIHKCGYLHRDIKPQNILIKIDNQIELSLYLVDFGLSTKYLNDKEQHMVLRTDKTLTGSCDFASLASHCGNTFSRGDQIQVIIYTLVYLRSGSLPWMTNLNSAKNQSKLQKEERVKKIKSQIPNEQLCKQLPKQFSQILYYARRLDFEQEPDYEYLKNTIKKCMKQADLNQQIHKCLNKLRRQ